MPNWTDNTITAKDEIIRKCLDKDGNFDFNLLIPMPGDLDVEDGSLSYFALILGNCTENEWIYRLGKQADPDTPPLSVQEITERNPSIFERYHVVPPVDSEHPFGAVSMSPTERFTCGTVNTAGDLFEYGKRLYSNLSRYGDTTWYGWRNKHWGCKWNAADTVYSAPSGNCEDATVYFNTPWCAPDGIFSRLCELYPGERIGFCSNYEEGFFSEGENISGKYVITACGEVRYNENTGEAEYFYDPEFEAEKEGGKNHEP